MLLPDVDPIGVPTRDDQGGILMPIYAALDAAILYRLPSGGHQYVAGLLCSALTAPSGPESYHTATVTHVLASDEQSYAIEPPQTVRLNPLHVTCRLTV